MNSKSLRLLPVSFLLLFGTMGRGEQPAPVAQRSNVYSPRDGLSPAQLVKFISDMQVKPRAIQKRRGFNAAVVEAAERLLDGDSSDKQKEVAILAKIEFLYRDVDGGNEAADAKLEAFVKSLKDNQSEKVAAQVRFYALEYRALAAKGLSAAKLRDLLADLGTFFKETTLTERHSRIATAAVAAIDRLAEGKEREAYFRTFGNMFAKNKDRTLAQYGTDVLKRLEDEAAKNSRPNEYWDVCEAVFRYQFGHNASGAQQRAKAYFLSVGGTDPPAKFLRRFERHRPLVKPGSQFKVGAGLQFRIGSFKWTGETTAEVEGGYYEGNLSSSGNTYRVQKTDSGWKVKGRIMSWISQSGRPAMTGSQIETALAREATTAMGISEGNLPEITSDA